MENINSLLINEETTLVTNFQKDKLPHYKGAVVLYQLITGDSTLTIEKNAYDVFNRLLDNYHSLHISESHDLSKFWGIFDKLKTIFN